MEEIEYQIINELLNDGQLPFSVIAKKIGVSSETVRRKYLELRKKGIITHCSIVLNISKIGYEGQAYLFINIAPNVEKSGIINHLRRIKYVTVIGTLIGDFDLTAITVIKNLNMFNKLLYEIKQIPGIERVETSITTNPISRKLPSQNKFTQNVSSNQFM